ncbi:MAG: hypothetical protein PVJ05_07365 [Candidatus Thorarchaeota archaeon]
MTETKSGKIIFAQIGKIPQTGETFGLITVKISDDEKIKLKIDDSTEYKKLKVGSDVTVSFEADGDSRFPVANSVVIK